MGITPKTQVHQSHCDHDLYLCKHVQTLFIIKSVAGIATDLTLLYANVSPVNVYNFVPVHVCIVLR